MHQTEGTQLVARAGIELRPLFTPWGCSALSPHLLEVRLGDLSRGWRMANHTRSVLAPDQTNARIALPRSTYPKSGTRRTVAKSGMPKRAGIPPMTASPQTAFSSADPPVRARRNVRVGRVAVSRRHLPTRATVRTIPRNCRSTRAKRTR